MGHLAKPRDASFFRVFFNPYHYGVLTNVQFEIAIFIHFKTAIDNVSNYAAATSFTSPYPTGAAPDRYFFWPIPHVPLENITAFTTE